MSAQKFENVTSVSLLVIFLFSILTNHTILARPGLMTQGPSDSEAEYLLTLKWLKELSEVKNEEADRERDLAEEQMEIQALLAGEAALRRDEQLLTGDLSESSSEVLPIPSAIVHNQPLHAGKRTSYMTLCHFKICNMGRKRQV